LRNGRIGLDVLGLLFLADVKLLGSSLALGESITMFPSTSDSTLVEHQFLGVSHPPADPVALEEPEPVAPSAMRRAATEK
jgi:hypothetical protein